MKVAMIVAVTLLLTSASVLCTDLDKERKAKLDRLKEDFDSALEQFEDKEAAQLCVALTGKADIAVLLQRIKESSEFTSLDQKAQAEVDKG